MNDEFEQYQHLVEDNAWGIFQKTPTPLFIEKKSQGSIKIIFCNQAACDLLGYSLKEMIGKDPLSLVISEMPGYVVDSIQARIMRMGVAEAPELRYLKGDGNVTILKPHFIVLEANQNSLEVFVLTILKPLSQVHADKKTINELRSTIQEVTNQYHEKLEKEKDNRRKRLFNRCQWLKKTIIEADITESSIDKWKKTFIVYIDNIVRLEVSNFAKIKLIFTPTEKKIVGHLLNHLSIKQIASAMGVSENTVKNHRRSIRSKLHITNHKINLSEYLNKLYS